MSGTIQRNLRCGYDGAPAIRIRDQHQALNCSGWLPCALREGTSTYQPEDERHDCYFLHHCDFLFASGPPLQFLRVCSAEPLCSKQTLSISAFIG
jgi:hypothetical protein